MKLNQVSQPHNTQPQAGNADWVVVILVPLSFMIVCATISSIVVAFCQVTRGRGSKVNVIRHYQQVPCTNCRFFNRPLA